MVVSTAAANAPRNNKEPVLTRRTPRAAKEGVDLAQHRDLVAQHHLLGNHRGLPHGQLRYSGVAKVSDRTVTV
jgi:hypothetical protein